MSTLKNEDPLILVERGDIQSRAIKKRSTYFSNCCYFSASTLKHSIYCIDTKTTADKTFNAQDNENQFDNCLHEVSEFGNNFFEGEDTWEQKSSQEFENTIGSKNPIAQRPHIIFNNDPQDHLNRIKIKHSECKNELNELSKSKELISIKEFPEKNDEIININILRSSPNASNISYTNTKNLDQRLEYQDHTRTSNTNRSGNIENIRNFLQANLQNKIVQPFIDSPEFVKIENKNFIRIDDTVVDPISMQSMIEIENFCPNPKLNKKGQNDEIVCSKNKSEESISLEASSYEVISQDKLSALDLDLYNLQLIEEKFSAITEGVNHGENVSKFCKEWWTLTSNKGFTQIYQIAKDFIWRKLIKKFIILSYLSIAMTDYLMYDNELNFSCHLHIKNTVFALYQGFLLTMDLVNGNIPRSEEYWKKYFNKIIQQKKEYKVLLKSKSSIMKQHLEEMIGILNNICQTAKRQDLYVRFKNCKENTFSLIDAIIEILLNIEKQSVITSKTKIEKCYEGTIIWIQQYVSEINTINETKDAEEEDDLNLPLVHSPFLPPLNTNQAKKIYTLVLDLDETLIHMIENENDATIIVRPGAIKFLEEMGKYYEVVIFTAGLQDYADKVIDEIDKKKSVKYRLYRQHTTKEEFHRIKDLSLLGRELSRIIIIDNLPESFKYQTENGICIESWTGDEDDTELIELMKFLKEIVINKIADVREALEILKKTLKSQLPE